jgi:hypothetical protein
VTPPPPVTSQANVQASRPTLERSTWRASVALIEPSPVASPQACGGRVVVVLVVVVTVVLVVVEEVVVLVLVVLVVVVIVVEEVVVVVVVETAVQAAVAGIDTV